jgi:hypothetical protein
MSGKKYVSTPIRRKEKYVSTPNFFRDFRELFHMLFSGLRMLLKRQQLVGVTL